MVTIKESRMEVLFGFFGVLFMIVILIICIFLSPGYSPLTSTISTLGTKEAKTLFSIGFVVAGSSLIPFYIYLKNELLYAKNYLRKIATGVAIFSNMCIALVGILPPEQAYIEPFTAFHAFVAGVSFIGTSIYIVLYSILMYQGSESPMYKGPKFKKYLAYYGFFVGIIFVIWLFNPTNPPLEWSLAMLIFIWILITAFQSLSFKFSKFPGVYYKRSEYPKKIELFKQGVQLLKNLEMEDHPFMGILKDNIEFIKKKIEQNQGNENLK